MFQSSSWPPGTIRFSILPEDTLADRKGELGIKLPPFSLVDDLLYLLSHSLLSVTQRTSTEHTEGGADSLIMSTAELWVTDCEGLHTTTSMGHFHTSCPR
ncbi:unnamed protein product [Pleuronectes platessa]|uniref:Uncharacterized protein n=1 Tax=Pleuronectes platessa TaxID=8262 RepID=A0A9N7VVT5_PLEPL|nr:unnamed protein product [Pleuronectes platessa]